MTIAQLPTPIEMETPLGHGWAIFTWEWTSMIWYGVAMTETGEMWWWQNHHVRLAPNISEGRYKISEIKLGAAMQEALESHKKRYGG